MNIGKTLFAQVMDFLPWKTFHRIASQHDSDRYVKLLNRNRNTTANRNDNNGLRVASTDTRAGAIITATGEFGCVQGPRHEEVGAR